MLQLVLTTILVLLRSPRRLLADLITEIRLENSLLSDEV
jgi:hypothetical protein